MDKVKELMSLCKCGVFISVNEHRDYYEKVEEFLVDRCVGNELEIEQEVMDRMVETDTIVNVHAYPDTPIGFFECYHYDLDCAVDEVIEAIKHGRTCGSNKV